MVAFKVVWGDRSLTILIMLLTYLYLLGYLSSLLVIISCGFHLNMVYTHVILTNLHSGHKCDVC